LLCGSDPNWSESEVAERDAAPDEVIAVEGVKVELAWGALRTLLASGPGIFWL